MKKIELIKEMLEVMEAAIESGDWTVDGACDPGLVMVWARNTLLDHGYHGYRPDGLTGTQWHK